MLNFLSQRRKVIFKIATIAALGGMLNGFMTAVIAGVVPIMSNDWSLSANQQEWLIASAILGAVLGAFISARSINWIGRKNTILVAAMIFGFGSLSCALANSILW